MAKQLFWTIALVLTFAIQANTQTCDLINEDFETASNVNAPAGWQRNNSYFGTTFPNSGTTHVGFNTLNDNLVLPPLTCPSEICFYWRASGASSNWDLDIDYSQDNGATWTTVQTIMTTGSGSPLTYSQTCVALPTTSFTAPFSDILLRFNQSRRVGGSCYLDDVCVSSGTCTVAPTQLTFSGLQSGCLQANTPFSVNICATDAGGNVDNTYANSITVTQATGSGTLSGTLSQIAANGCATFTNLSFSAADTYTLSATSSGLNGSSSPIQMVGTCPTTNTLKIMTYNLLQYPNSTNLCSNPTVIPNRADTLAIITSYVEPDVLMVCELQTEAGADFILNNALNINGLTKYARAGWSVNTSPGGTSLNNGFFYNTDQLTFYSQDKIPTDVRDINVYTLYSNDPNLANHQDTIFMDFYVAHLKAGSGVGEQAQRAIECQAIQDYITAQPSDRNAIIGGDFNVYDSSETAYQTLLSGSYPFNDPINSPGSWANNAAFASIHTQSTRAFGDPAYDCGATGGVDDRFDFLLLSNSVMNNAQNVQYVANSYTALGNNGSTLNRAINSNDNTSNIPQNVLNALYYMSDHLPVLLDVEITFPLLLPVELTHFSAQLTTEKSIELNWNAIENEVENYEIERSIDGLYFQKIANQKAGHNTYQYIDEHLPTGIKEIYYRLKINDLNAYYEYSKLKTVFVNTHEWTVKAFPNPANNELNIQFLGIQNTTANIQLFNNVGQLFFQEKGNTQNSITIDLENWERGLYWLFIESENEYIRQAILIQ